MNFAPDSSQPGTIDHVLMPLISQTDNAHVHLCEYSFRGVAQVELGVLQAK
jgi:hypothetical protein